MSDVVVESEFVRKIQISDTKFMSYPYDGVVGANEFDKISSELGTCNVVKNNGQLLQTKTKPLISRQSHIYFHVY